MQTKALVPAILVALMCVGSARAAVLVDTTPGTGAPPALLGGYTMGAFPSDPTAEGTLVSDLSPPVSAPVVGNLEFTDPVEHMLAGSLWDTWSHGYTGDVYFNDNDDLLMFLPNGTLAFYLYVQPNLKDVFEFALASGLTVTTLDIDGDGGASYVGFYTDDPLDPLQFVFVRQTTNQSDGFAVGEFGINVNPDLVPEPATVILLLGGLPLAAVVRARRKER